MTFSAAKIRQQFPALRPDVVFFDNPGATQVPRQVLSAMENYFVTSNANRHGEFATSQKTEEVIRQAREAFADFLNASQNEIVFGPNMTTLTFQISRALGRTIRKGDEIIVTRLDHDANVAPWLALEELGAVLRWVDINERDCTLNMDELKKSLNSKTKIVAVGGASNAAGSINDIKDIAALAHTVGAIVFVDAVQLAPHAPIDVRDLDCDFLALSVYKFFGPHIGVLYGKYHVLEQLQPYKVRPADNNTPDRFETGTQNHEGLAGATAAVDYLASIGQEFGQSFREQFNMSDGRRLHLKTALASIKAYERQMCIKLVEGLQKIRGIQIYGIADSERFDYRTPTVSFNLGGMIPGALAAALGRENINASAGNFYAYELMNRLGLEKSGGAVRVGLAHYSTVEEIDKFLSVIQHIVSKNLS